MSRGSAVRKRPAIAVAAVLVLAVVVAVAAALVNGRSPEARVAGITAGPGAAIGGESPSPTPRSTAGYLDDGIPPAEGGPTSGPGIAVSPEPILPAALLTSCNPGAVPGAIPAPTIGVAAAGNLALHVPILMYHRIVPFAQAGDSLHGLVVPPDEFAAQMAALKAAGWHTITVGQLADDLAAGQSPGPRTLAISFDDGYWDGYKYALPILQQNGFVGTFFVIPGRIGDGSFLSAAEMQALTAAGDEIGDHTMDHVNLAAETPARMTYEIQAAAARIAEVTGHWPRSFAYPFGRLDDRVVAAVAACSQLRIAVTTVPGAHETWGSRFEVPRVRVSPGTSTPGLLAELERYR